MNRMLCSFGRRRSVYMLGARWASFFSGKPRHEKLLEDIKKDVFFDPKPNQAQTQEIMKLINEMLERGEKAKTAPKFKTAFPELQGVKKPDVATFPTISSTSEAVKYVEDYFQGLSMAKHAGPVSAPIPPVTIASVLSALLSSYYNPNLAWQEMGTNMRMAERETIDHMIDLLGYDKEKARGFFTFGGTATNMYAIKLAALRTMPNMKREGITEKLKVLTCESSMFAKLHVMNWLGLGTDSLVRVKANEKGQISLPDLEQAARKILSDKIKLGAIILNHGSVDSFAFDPIEEVVKMRDNLVREFKLDYEPLIHLDACLGWAWAVFSRYDFDKNPLQFNQNTLDDLKYIAKYGKQISKADSIGSDFHKSGYAPLSSSLFMVKDEQYLAPLKRSSAEMPFFETSNLPGVFTLETSRNAFGVVSGLANLKALGIEGYQVLLANALYAANLFKEKLSKRDDCVVLNLHNPGPVVVFRMYPDKEAKAMFAAEMDDDHMKLELTAANAFNRRLLRALQKEEGISLAKHESFKRTSYGEPLVSLKMFFFSPFANTQSVDDILRSIDVAKDYTMKKIADASGTGG